ncbi:TetR family transcriptional regulator [Kitasatospora griseola]|uniref:TetR family transcriptional regulator n=1 Tax=Kitasatospora griseola TaxID=2064 RepID=A0A0D0PRY8_KITGR|nr:TetR/AcrR family transcriptional regulator [Kitasatospora griseola]KIQ65314.1 TetR family transcriptional regulator [Kitasatospora griseola]
MVGLRELKKERTGRRIAEQALRLFAERGFEDVTMGEVARASEVARATLFAYYPTKESLVLAGVAGDDLAATVADRPDGQSALAALRAHHRALAAGPVAAADLPALLTRVRVIQASPALRAAADSLRYRQRQALADVLAAEHGETAGTLMAAQIAASLAALQERHFARLVAGAPAEQADRMLAEDLELAFDLLEHGHSGTREQ